MQCLESKRKFYLLSSAILEEKSSFILPDRADWWVLDSFWNNSNMFLLQCLLILHSGDELVAPTSAGSRIKTMSLSYLDCFVHRMIGCFFFYITVSCHSKEQPVWLKVGKKIQMCLIGRKG